MRQLRGDSRRHFGSAGVAPTPRLSTGALACLGLAAILAAGPAPVHFPDGPITLVVGASAGGGVDASARLIGARISEALRQPVVIENRPGAYSRIASAVVAKAPPDGHSLLVITATAAIDIAVDPAARPNALQGRRRHAGTGDPRCAAVRGVPTIAANMGATPFVTTPAEFDSLLRNEVAKWERVIKSSRVPVE